MKFYAGGAIGFDSICSLAVLDLKEFNKDIELHLVLPCPQYQKNWRTENITEYEMIKINSDSMEYISSFYYDNCNLHRNKCLVDKSDIVIAYYDGRARGGTKHTINYAKSKNKPVINLYKYFV